jgi:hypothetical protein
VFDSSLLLIYLLVWWNLLFSLFSFSSSLCRTPLNSFCSAGVMVMNSFRFCLSWKVLISSSIMWNNFAGYSNLGWKIFSSRSSNTSFWSSLLLEFLLMNLLLFWWEFAFIGDFTLLFYTFHLPLLWIFNFVKCSCLGEVFFSSLDCLEF